MSMTEAVFERSKDLLGLDAGALPEALGRFLAAFIGRPYSVAAAVLEGPGGERTEAFSAVVFEDGDEVPEAGTVPVLRTAAVVVASAELTLDELRTAYARIAEAKRLRQTVTSRGGRRRQRDGLVGVVLGLRSSMTLEGIAEEMERLNAGLPATQWPDVVAVADTGVVQYGVQFPGENVTGDFFLPDAKLSYTAPMYILMVMKPAGAHTLNRLLAFIVGHMALFAPGAEVPSFPEIVKGLPSNGVVTTGYQCNLSGELVPVPRQFYNDRFLAPLPFTIEDKEGTILATVQYLPWQDGGVIIVRGKFPLEILLVLLGPRAKNVGIVPRPGRQISYAMPVSEADFLDLLKRLEKQSNVVVRADRTNWVVKKFADEGSSSPFMARLLIGMLRLRDAAFADGAQRDAFDSAYQSVMTPLLDARARMRKVTALWESHAQRVRSGEVARLHGRTIHVAENVDGELGQEMDAFLSATTRALKTGMQAVAGVLGTGIGFLFQKQAAFEAGLVALEASDPTLAAYLRETRSKWSDSLIQQRNAVEHENWRLPEVIYEHDGQGVRAREPDVDGMPMSAFAGTMFDRLSCFAEEVTAHLLQGHLMKGITITELPPGERQEEAPERFRITPSLGGLMPWSIAYHSQPFEET